MEQLPDDMHNIEIRLDSQAGHDGMWDTGKFYDPDVDYGPAEDRPAGFRLNFDADGRSYTFQLSPDGLRELIAQATQAPLDFVSDYNLILAKRRDVGPAR